MDGMDRKIIAVCTSWEDEENLNLMMLELIGATEGTPYLPMCVTFDRSSVEARGEESLDEFMQAFEVPNLAGFLLLGEMIRSDAINQRLIDLAARKKLPVFMLERQYDGCINLMFTYLQGFESVARHMVQDHGCRDVVVVAGIRGNPFSEDRITLCREILRESGAELPPERIIYGDFWDEPTFRALDSYFEGGGKMPKAFFCINDAMAIAVCIYLTRLGIQVPEDVMVSGFDGILPGEEHEPSITTARPDFPGMFGTMLARMDRWRPEEAGVTERIPVPFRFFARQSCGCEASGRISATLKISDQKITNLDFTRHIRAMGLFIRKTQDMDSLEEFIPCLSPLFSAWPNPYYFAAVLGEDRNQARPLLYGSGRKFGDAPVLRWRESPVPDVHEILSNPEIRILMVQLLQTRAETIGYMVSGIRHWSLREQERFEEEVLFLCSALNTVIRNRRLEEANREILRMAEHDYMTGLYNRRGFLRELERLLALPESQNQTLTLFAMDMDRLKGINDRYGHHEGDAAIRCLAEGIRQAVEGRGICARYGGDEVAFAILSGDEKPDPEKIRTRIETTARAVSGQKAYLISASLGSCACQVRNHPPLDQLLAESDRTLYADKTARR